jgi:hypothetical protein
MGFNLSNLNNSLYLGVTLGTPLDAKFIYRIKVS